MAASTGSPASRRSTKLTPLTTRPSLTSRQGITRTLNMKGLPKACPGEVDPVRRKEHASTVECGPRVSDQRQCRRWIKPSIVKRAARDGAGQFFGGWRQQRLDVLDRGEPARRDHRNGNVCGKLDGR